jgi:hypothetical protein
MTTTTKASLQPRHANSKATGLLCIVIIVADPTNIVFLLKNEWRLGSEPAVGGVVVVRGKEDNNVNASRIPLTLALSRAVYASATANQVLSNPSSLIRLIKCTMTSNVPHAFGTMWLVQGEAMRWLCGLIGNLTHAFVAWVGGGGWGTGGNKDRTPLLSLSSLLNDEDKDDAAKKVCSL